MLDSVLKYFRCTVGYKDHFVTEVSGIITGDQLI